MIARVLTVKSITDWKVRIGARLPSRLSRARRLICSCNARLSWKDWRAPLTGKELYLNGMNSGSDAQPGGLGEGREEGRPAGDAGEAREFGDADHRRDQHEPVGARQLGVLDRVQRVLHRQRTAVREADEMQRLARPDASAGLADREPRRRRPVLPFDLGERRRHGAVRRQAWDDRDIAPLAVELADMPLAERRVREPMQQHGRTHGRSVGLEHVRAVPVVGEMAGIDRAALEVAVDRNPLLGTSASG